MIIVEDGSVVANANAFGDTAGADTYHQELGQTAWTGTSTVKEQAILRAMRYLESLEEKMEGTRIGTTQELAWPRYGMTDKTGNDVASDTVPEAWINAMYEAALIELVSPGALQPELEFGGAPVLSKSVKAGSVSSSKTYQGGYINQKVYTVIRELISPFLERHDIWNRA